MGIMDRPAAMEESLRCKVYPIPVVYNVSYSYYHARFSNAHPP